MTISATPPGPSDRPGPTSRRAPKRAGFTLLELLLTVAVIALVAALAGPSLQVAARRLGVDTANHQLLSLLREARAWSVRTGRVCLVTLEPA